MNKINLLTCFLYIYFYEIEQKLNSTKNELLFLNIQLFDNQ